MSAAWAMLGVFLLGAGVLWAIGWHTGRAACDQYDYHLKVIVQFARELPRPELHDYWSATTPGYHLVLAALARAATADPLLLQVAASVFTVGLLVVLGRAVGRAGAPRDRSWLELVALTLPFVVSPYVFTSGVWLLPDNAGWLLALAVVLVCLRGTMSMARIAWCGVLMLALVLVRQSHLWAAAPVVAAAWLVGTPDADASLAGAFRSPGSRLSRTALACAACIPALAALAWFAKMWHGLIPPSLQKQHMGGVNWVTVPFVLALIGLFSPLYLGWLWPAVTRLWRESRPAVVVIVLGAIVWTVIPETTFLYEPRAGGLWSVVGALDRAGLSIAHHTSPLILLLAPLGAVALAAWLAMIDDKRRWIVAAAVAAFLAAQSLNANCWQRYHEPFLLMMFALIGAAYGPGPDEAGWTRRPGMLAAWRIAGPLVLATILAALTIGGMLYGRDPLLPDPKQPAVSSPHDPGR